MRSRLSRARRARSSSDGSIRRGVEWSDDGALESREDDVHVNGLSQSEGIVCPVLAEFESVQPKGLSHAAAKPTLNVHVTTATTTMRGIILCPHFPIPRRNHTKPGRVGRACRPHRAKRKAGLFAVRSVPRITLATRRADPPTGYREVAPDYAGASSGLLAAP